MTPGVRVKNLESFINQNGRAGISNGLLVGLAAQHEEVGNTGGGFSGIALAQLLGTDACGQDAPRSATLNGGIHRRESRGVMRVVCHVLVFLRACRRGTTATDDTRLVMAFFNRLSIRASSGLEIVFS